MVTLTNNAPTNMMGGTTWYLNGDNNNLLYDKEVKANGVTENRHYLQAAGMTFAMVVSRTGPGISAAAADPSKRTAQISYYQQDHLGSIAAITDETGAVIERLAYDTWGKRRYPNGIQDKADSIVGVNTDRGYTMHEHLDEVGVIHMNGRVYDPLIGRFMSADPFIQSPGNLQSYNRYAYVMNNPLAMTDPSGYWSLGGFFRSLVNVVKVAVVVYVAYTTGDFVKPWALLNGYSAGTAVIAAGAAGGAAAGFTGSALNGGNLRQDITAGLQGGFSGALFGAAGTVGGAGAEGANSFARYAAHAGAGCISTVASGGGCGQGAASAVFGKYTTNAIGSDKGWLSGDIAKGVATTIAGGVGSVIAGGKFENGATTAAFGYLFNAMAQDRLVPGGYGNGVADEGKGGVTWKSNYPATIAVDGQTADALQCTAQCIGSDLFGTGGQERSGHSAGSHHYSGEAVDFRPLTVQSSKVFSCSANCGFEAGWFENWGNPHWHFQLRPGNGVPRITPEPVIKRNSVRGP